MARIRSVHPKICESDDMVGVPAEVERTFVRLWTHCDDEGRCKDNPLLIKAAIYPVLVEMTAELVDVHLRDLSRRGLVVRYEVDGQRYLAIPSWPKYQKPQKPRPSEFPPPESGVPVGLPDESRSDTGSVEDEYAAGGGGELEVKQEGERTKRVPQWHDLLRADADPSLLQELDDDIAALCDAHGADRVSHAVAALLAEWNGSRRRWPSDVRKALDARIGPASSDPPRPKVVESVDDQIARLRDQLALVDDEADREGIRALIADLEGAA